VHYPFFVISKKPEQMRFFPGLLLLFCTHAAVAQDLSGTWEGTGGSGAEYLKLVILRVGDHYVGYSYDSGTLGSCQANFSGSFRAGEQRLRGGGKGFIRSSFGHSQMSFDLNYYEHEGAQWLQGQIKPRGVAAVMSFGLASAEATLKRISLSTDTTEFMQKAIAALKPPPVQAVAEAVSKTDGSSLYQWQLNPFRIVSPKLQ
jgi:hypothetical protein